MIRWSISRSLRLASQTQSVPPELANRTRPPACDLRIGSWLWGQGQRTHWPMTQLFMDVKVTARRRRAGRELSTGP